MVRTLFSLWVKLKIVVNDLDSLEQRFLSDVAQVVLRSSESADNLLLAHIRLFKLFLELLEEFLRM